MADNQTFTLRVSETPASGSGSVYEILCSTNVSYTSMPPYSKIIDNILSVSVRETSNKLGNADIYVGFGGATQSITKELYYGNGVVPKSSNFFTTPDISLKEYTSSENSSSGLLSYSGADRIYLRFQSSLVSRNYAYEASMKFTWNDPRAIVTVSGGSGAGTYHYGTNISLTPNVPSGYRFSHWLCSNGKTYTSNSITVDTGIITAYETSLTFTAVLEKLPPQFTLAEMRYLDKQISVSNKVIAGEGFIIAVGIT